MENCKCRRIADAERLALLASLWTLTLLGCGGSSDPKPKPAPPAAKPPARTTDGTVTPPQRDTAAASRESPAASPAPKKDWRNSLTEVLHEADAENRTQRAVAPLPVIDENRLAVAGIRKLTGKHLTLYTDLPSQPAIDELPQVFDLAVPQWCAYFGIDPAKTADWRMQACVMDRKEAFAGAGLLPADLPPFLHGFQRGLELWCYEQPSDYYRRHLLLHEGTHGFMKSIVGGGGPPWYFEGMAELLGTHRWSDGKLQLGYFPRSREETPMWGRIKIVQDEFAASRGLTLPKVFNLGPQAHLQLVPYGWSWAAAAFLDGNPRTQAAFRKLRDHVRLTEPDFSDKLLIALGDQWLPAVEEWQLFVAHADYGYDLTREAVAFRTGAPLPSAGQRVTIAADRGWQSSGIAVEEGKSYRVTATGKYSVAQTPRPWECEPNGVTLRYHRGLPLGCLLGTVRLEKFAENQVSALLNPGPIGSDRTIRAPGTGVLYFRINDSPAEVADNAGELTVQVVPQP